MKNSLLTPFLNENNRMEMLAFDHRGSFKKTMTEHNNTITDQDVVALKKKIIAASVPYVSGILIDQDYGLPAYKELGVEKPFLLPLEKTGYTDTAGERITEILYTPESLKEVGALGAKLLLYTNPNVPSWVTQMSTAKKMIQVCKDAGIPIFLEFVLYTANNVAPGTVAENVEKAIADGVYPDVWKIPYPGSKEECQKVTTMVGDTPWILLTGGGTFDDFLLQNSTAKDSGCLGFLAGRSIWSEACSLFDKKEELDIFLNNVVSSRYKNLTAK